MSVRGEFRRLLGDMLLELNDAQLAPESVRALEPLAKRAGDDLPGAATSALAVLPTLDARAFTDGAARSRFEDAYERLEAVCRIILGR